MIGAIIGDIVGSRFEFNNHRNKEFQLFTEECRFTDDSIMTLAVAKAILEARKIQKPRKIQEQPATERDRTKKGDTRLGEMTVRYLQKIGRRYPECGYGGMFSRWLFSDDPRPYNSFGNGAAMRVSPAGFAARTKEEAIALSKAVTEVTHNHQEGLKGAQATAVAIYMGRHGYTKNEIRNEMNEKYYPLYFTLDEIRDSYEFNETCQDTVPQAIVAFLESTSFEDAIRSAISIGGDSDTLGAITGGIAEAYYGVPQEIKDKALSYLDNELLTVYREWINYLGEDGTVGKFHVVTKYTNIIPGSEPFGKWVTDSEDASRLPYVDYSETVKLFIQEFYDYTQAHPEYGLHRYESVLVNKGLDHADCSMRKADVEAQDAQCVLALIMGAIQSERSNSGALLHFLKDGYILKWLMRLQDMDQSM